MARKDLFLEKIPLVDQVQQVVIQNRLGQLDFEREVVADQVEHILDQHLVLEDQLKLVVIDLYRQLKPWKPVVVQVDEVKDLLVLNLDHNVLYIWVNDVEVLI